MWLLAVLLLLPALGVRAQGDDPEPPWRQLKPLQRPPKTRLHFLPYQSRAAQKTRERCEQIPGASFADLSVLPPATDRPAAQHADLNLALRSYEPVAAGLGYVWIDGPTDGRSPRLDGLFAPSRQPPITGVFQVYDWDWGCNCRGDLIAQPEVTFAEFASTPLEILHLPASGYDIGDGYQALVLYAEPTRITLKY
ncbi:MAG: hypothetical protein D6775_09920, partial [Caldilineae bacterium]